MQIAFNTKYCREPNARVIAGRYSNGQIALQVFSDIGEPLSTATVNLEQYGETPSAGNVFIYGDYSEHVGVYKALLDAGVIGESVRTVQLAYDATALECPLLMEVGLHGRPNS